MIYGIQDLGLGSDFFLNQDTFLGLFFNLRSTGSGYGFLKIYTVLVEKELIKFNYCNTIR